jgi:hypothetical protein
LFMCHKEKSRTLPVSNTAIVSDKHTTDFLAA